MADAYFSKEYKTKGATNRKDKGQEVKSATEED